MQTVLIQTIAAFCGCFFFAIVLGAPYKEVLWGGLSGVLSQFLLSVITLTLENPVIATFVASFSHSRNSTAGAGVCNLLCYV